jgi:hypothetical protein
MSADTQTTLSTYIAAISSAYATGKATEHSYRPAIKALIEGLAPDVVATNEPKRIECGAPDIILAKDDVPVGFIETKVPFDADLEGRNANREQFGRYLAALDKVVFTDFLRFRFFEKGQLKADITLGGMSNEILVKPLPDGAFLSSRIVPDNSAFRNFADTFRAWCAAPVQSIRSAMELSRMMAGPPGPDPFPRRHPALRKNPPRPRPHRRNHGGDRRPFLANLNCLSAETTSRAIFLWGQNRFPV